MMGPVIGSAAMSIFCSISQSSRLSLHLARLLSVASSSQGFQSRSLLELSFGERHIPALKFKFSNRSKGIQCYCTKTKSEHLQNAEILRTTEVSNIKSMQEMDGDKEIVVENNTVLHVGEQINTSRLSGSGTVNHEWECINEDDPIDDRALIELEVELLRQEACKVPDTLTSAHWEELFTLTSRNARKKYLRFLFLNQMKRENRREKKELRRIEREKDEEKYTSQNRYISEDGHIKYGLWCNSIFLRIRHVTMDNFYNSRVITALMHGQPLVIDLGFDGQMQTKERQNCAKQLMNSFANNRTHPDPFYLHFCNADRSSDTMQRLNRFIPTLYDPEFPLTVTSESYLNHFPKEKLIYLTPHCNEEVTRFDHDAIYIIGAIVDLGDSEPLTLAKARREGIRMQKFPLDRYLNWGMGGKSLTIDHTLNIMLDLKHTDDWYYTLKQHVPRRKLKSFEDHQTQLENYVRKSLKRDRSIKGRYQHNRSSNQRIKDFYEE